MIFTVFWFFAYVNLVLGDSFYQMCFEETNYKRLQQNYTLLEANAILQMETQEYVNRIAAGLVDIPRYKATKPPLYAVPREILSPQPQQQQFRQVQQPAYNTDQSYPGGFLQKQNVKKGEVRSIIFKGNPNQKLQNQKNNLQNQNQKQTQLRAFHARPQSASFQDMSPNQNSWQPSVNQNYGQQSLNPNYDQQSFNQNYRQQTPLKDVFQSPTNYKALLSGDANGPKKFASQNGFASQGGSTNIFFEDGEEMASTLRNAQKFGCAIAKGINGGAFVVINYQ